MGCFCEGKKFLKNLMIIFNMYYWFSGSACLGLGIWFLLVIRQLEPAVDSADFSVPSYLMITAGGAIIIYGVIGCIAIFNENRCMLGFYFVLLASSFATQIASCLKLFFMYDNIESQVTYHLNISIRYKYSLDSDITLKVNNLQQEFSCCGVRNSSDWKTSLYDSNSINTAREGQMTSYPSSCCVYESSSSHCNLTYTATIADANIFETGCASPISSKVKFFSELVGWSSFGMGAMQLIGGVLLYCFRTAVR